MKKNKMMRMASMLLILVLLTTCTISGTFAKYTTSGTGTDTARVAHFGVTVYANSDMFDAEYEGVADSWTAKATVKAKTNDNLVAPGTTMTMASVEIVGVPEVAVRVSNDVEKFDIGDKWMVDSDSNGIVDKFYCPLIFTIIDAAGVTAHISGLDYNDATEFENAVIGKIETATAEYDPLTDLGTLDDADQTLEITWQWAFEGSDDSSALSYGQNDLFDTQLGDAVDKGTVEIEVVTYVTQID